MYDKQKTTQYETVRDFLNVSQHSNQRYIWVCMELLTQLGKLLHTIYTVLLSNEVDLLCKKYTFTNYLLLVTFSTFYFITFLENMSLLK